MKLTFLSLSLSPSLSLSLSLISFVSFEQFASTINFKVQM